MGNKIGHNVLGSNPWNTKLPRNLNNYTSDFVYLFDLIKGTKTVESFREACEEFDRKREELPENERRKLAYLIRDKGNEHKDSEYAIHFLNMSFGYKRKTS